MSVKNTHKSYDKMAPKWERCDDVMLGQDAMRARTIGASVKHMSTMSTDVAYIPALKEQTPQDYAAYVHRAPFYNATWRTIAGLNGMLFRKPPKVEVPAAIEPLLKDVTLSGQPFQMFAQDIGEQCLGKGRVGVLVDYPQAPVKENGAPLTLADARMLQLRPTMSSYEAESIINWRERTINNQRMLVLVVLTEQNEQVKDGDEFKEESETQYRVLDLTSAPEMKYRQRLYRIDKDGKDEQIGDDIYPQMNNKSMDFIPFVFISTDDITPEVDEPPLIDLVDMNIAHWRTTADYEHGCHFTGLPTAVVSGYTPKAEGEKLYIGSATAWIFPDPAASATYLETNGNMTALKENIEAKEQRMAVMGARMLEALAKGVESAQTASIHRTGEQATMANTAMTISLGLTRALRWFCEWAGSPDEEARVDLNRDFYPVTMDSGMFTSQVSAYIQGAISFETLFANLQQAELIAPSKTSEEEQEQIANDIKTAQANNPALQQGEQIPVGEGA